MSSLWDHDGPPVPDDLSVLRHSCTGASCEFLYNEQQKSDRTWMLGVSCMKIAIHRVQCPLAVQLQAHFVEWN